MERHRIEVLDHLADRAHEAWSSPDGRVLLIRSRDEPAWRAAVDFVVVTDAERMNRPSALEEPPTDALLRASSPEALAQRLGRQERIHIVFATPERGGDATRVPLATSGT